MTRWDGPLAEALLLRAGGFRAPGRYQLEAAVESAHSVRRHGQAPDPQAILLLYEALHARTRSPVAAVNHAVALCAAAGPAAALEALDVLAGTHACPNTDPTGRRGHTYWRCVPAALKRCRRTNARSGWSATPRSAASCRRARSGSPRPSAHNAPMLEPRHLRDLRVAPATHPRGQPHLGAASGLVRVGRFLHVVADDEHHLGCFDADDHAAPVQLLRLCAGDLPAGKAQRKRLKPDLEALVSLPPTRGAPHGRLLALGSGSTALRERAFVLALAADGRAAGAPCEIDLRAWYAPLRTHFADLNIEGAFVQEAQLHLLQRANAGSRRNAVLTYALDAFSAWLEAGGSSAPPAARVQPMELGGAHGVPMAGPTQRRGPAAAGCSARWPRRPTTAMPTEPALRPRSAGCRRRENCRSCCHCAAHPRSKGSRWQGTGSCCW